MTLEEWLAADISMRTSPEYVARVERKIAAAEAHAAAQQATAEAMAGMIAAQQASAQALLQPAALAKPTREELVLRALLALPEITGQTDLGMVDLATKKIDAFLIRYPQAVST